ncbi:MAG: SRPBCC family protein [Thiotrichaceae bacterium]
MPYSAEQMYVLVNDIETYPSFYRSVSPADTVQKWDAYYSLYYDGYHWIRKSFTTNNVLQHNHSIEMCLLEGPFSQLHGFWKFQAGQEDAKFRLTCSLKLLINCSR